MKKIRKICTVLLCTGALLLSGCAKDTDLSARYDDFMKYSFGADYRFEFTESYDDRDLYDLSFQDHIGKPRTATVWVNRYSKRDDAYKELSKTEFYDMYAEAAVIDRIVEICRDEIMSRIIGPCFPTFKPGAKHLSADLGDASIIPISLPLVYLTECEEEDIPELRKRLDPQTGWQACKADLFAVARDPEWYIGMNLTINEGVDPAPFLEQMKEAEQLFLEEVQTPQNFAIFVSQKQNGKTERLYHSFYIFGEKIDAEKRLAENPGYQPLGEAREIRRAKQ